MKFTANSRYFDRELSWLFFNSRVLEEARNNAVPLMERVRFLSISASNLDEFYMVRVAGLRTQVLAGMETPGVSGYVPVRQLQKIAKRTYKIKSEQDRCWSALKKLLRKENVTVKTVAELSSDDRAVLDDIYERTILPILSPIAVDPAHPFPFIPNLGFGMALSLKRRGDEEPLRALIPIPSHVPRFVCLSESRKGADYVMIEDVLAHYAPALFPDFTLLDCGEFRVTRDSDIAVDEEAEDLVRHFEFLLKKTPPGPGHKARDCA